MELTLITAAVAIAAGVLVVAAAVLLRVLLDGRWDLAGRAARLADHAALLAGELPGRFGRLARRLRQELPGLEQRDGNQSASDLAGDEEEAVRPVPPEGTLALSLILGLLAVAVTATGVTKVVDDVTEGGGVAVLDHPVARFVAARRVQPLTSLLDVVTNAGGPAGMAALALIAGALLAVAWRSWTPVLVLGVTYAGIAGITLAVKSVVGRPRPPVAHALQSVPGFSFPSAHAAIAISVCGAAAWLCGLRMRSWPGKVALWMAAMMIAALVGLSRIYLGVHWTSDVIGGWAFGALWLAVVVSAWAIFTRSRRSLAQGRPDGARPPR